MVLEGVYSKTDNVVGKLYVDVTHLPMPLELPSSVHNLRVNLANFIEGGYHICNACTQGQQRGYYSTAGERTLTLVFGLNERICGCS